MLLQSIEDKQFAAQVKSIAHSLSRQEEIDWEQRRYEIAKSVIGNMRSKTPEEMAAAAVQVADALISALRKTL